MIAEDYVSFEVAKLLKDEGFNEDIDLWYDENGEMFFEHKYDIGRNWRLRANKKVYECPTLQMAIKWLRKNHQIFIRPNISFLYPIKWYSEIFCYGDNLQTQQDIKTEYYDSPEEACEAAIKYCLETII